MSSPALREIWQLPPAGPCSDLDLFIGRDLDLYCRGHAGPCSDENDDEDCDVASGSNIELDVNRDSSTAATTGTSTVTELSTRRFTTSQPTVMSLLTVQLPPREASVFFDKVDKSREKDKTQEKVVLYDGRSRFTTSLGMNIGLIVGIAAGVVILTLIVAYAVCKYRGGRVRRLGRAACRAKVPRTLDKDPAVTAETGLLAGGVTDHNGRKTTTTPLLCRDPAANYSMQKTANGFDSEVRRKRKDVNEWYV